MFNDIHTLSENAEVAKYLGVNYSGEILYYNKEQFNKLVSLLFAIRVLRIGGSGNIAERISTVHAAETAREALRLMEISDSVHYELLLLKQEITSRRIERESVS